jgi:hypothetical protein
MAIDFQIKLIQQRYIFAQNEESVSSFWVLTANLSIIGHVRA